jgi:hypothetical protein
MINIKNAIDRAKVKVSDYNKTHVKKWKPYIVANKILWLFWLTNKVEYIPFWGQGNKGLTQQELKKLGRML